MASDLSKQRRSQQLRNGFEITEPLPSVLVVRLNRPLERNPLTIATLTALRAELLKCSASERIKTIIFTGSDNVFASGANIRELMTLDPRSARTFAEVGQGLMNEIASAPQLTIAAINGYCMGGGLDLALACDIRVASPNATFAHPGARLGIITGWGGTQRLPRLIGRTRALELFLTTRAIVAAEAFHLGLIDGVAEPVISEALRLATLSS